MSKFKAAFTETLPKALAFHLGSREFARRLKKEVLGTELRVDTTRRPSEHFVQKPDEIIEDEEGVFGIELTLSKVSVKDGRFFRGALTAMERVLTEAIESLCDDTVCVQIFCVIQTDVPVPGTSSTLFEADEAIWVRGKKAPIEAGPTFC